VIVEARSSEAALLHAAHKETAVGTKNLKFGLIRTKKRFPPI
jgi:hypothetical protein